MDDYIVETGKVFNESMKNLLRKEFLDTLNFIEENFPNGLKKSGTAKSIPRVRFEAISVGTILALRIRPELSVSNLDWLESEEFKKLTTSDGANSKNKVIGRIEFVRDCLLSTVKSNTLTYVN